MAKGMIRLQEELHNKILNLRSIESMVRRPQFERLWEDSDEAEQAKVKYFISGAHREAVVRWIRLHPSLELEEKKLSVLKDIATKFGIKNVSRQGKLQLIRAIKEKEKNGTQ